MKEKRLQMIGVGSPVIDFVTEVPEETISLACGEKGGMELVDARRLEGLLNLAGGRTRRTPGGSAGNTTFALARMGMDCALLGKLGDDANGGYYREAFDAIGGDGSRFKNDCRRPTACCVSLVTPDAERTMRTCLGAAQHLTPAEIEFSDFEGCRHVHVEGYLLFNRLLVAHVLQTAKRAGCSVSLDLGSFEVVRESRGFLPEILSRYVDMVFANADEAAEFSGDDDPQTGLEALGRRCRIAAVKVGADGAWLKEGGRTVRVAALPTTRLRDTTGAGDYWAAGFLYGQLNGLSLAESGGVASLLGRNVIEHQGAVLPPHAWEGILAETAELSNRKERIAC